MTAAEDNLDVAHFADFLAGDYARLRLYMGLSAFNRMAQLCAASVNSPNATARSLSQRLPSFLMVTRPYSKSLELSELALVEGAFNEALCAPDAPVLTFAEFSRLNLRDFFLDVHPSVQRLQLRTNATSLWAALTAGELPPPPGLLEAPQELLVWRQGLMPRFRMLGEEEALALDDAASGKLACGDHLPENFLRGWLEAEVISAVRDLNGAGEK